MYEKDEKNYYKPVWVNSFWYNNYIEDKSNCDKNKILSVEEFWSYLRDFINDLKQSGTWKM